MTPHLRIARPVSDLARTRAMYAHGLGLHVVGAFEDHDGFDGVMLGIPGGGWHFEFTYCRRHRIEPAPTAEDLAVLYLPEADAWLQACERMLAAGFQAVRAFNPYWEASGRTFEDGDGYRVVLQNSPWPGEKRA